MRSIWCILMYLYSVEMVRESSLYFWEVIQPMLFSVMTNELRNSRRDYKRIKLQDKVHVREVKEKQKKKNKFQMAELQTLKNRKKVTTTM